MLRTISIGNHVQIQGILVRTLDNGKVVVSVDNREYQGQLINRIN